MQDFISTDILPQDFMRLSTQNHVQNKMAYFSYRLEGAHCTLLETSHLKINILGDKKCLFVKCL